jgi:hypothetical protein
MNERDAKAALRAQGIPDPSPQLVEDYMRVQQADEWALEVPEHGSQEPQGQQQTEQDAPRRIAPKRPSSKSNLAPMLRERGELARERGPRRAGRPRVEAPWFQAVATVMADGTPLREALRLCGISGLSAQEVRALYRNRAFQILYKEARRKFLSDYGRRSPHALRKMRQYADL